jgi:hypothetical protein
MIRRMAKKDRGPLVHPVVPVVAPRPGDSASSIVH